MPIKDITEINESYLDKINLYADLIFSYCNDYIFIAFSNLCLFPNKNNFQQFINLFKVEIDNNIHRQYFKVLKVDFEKVILEYTILENVGDIIQKEVFQNFIPIPDYNNRDEIIAMLPQIPAFSNLYARINKYKHDNNLDQIKLIHDEQKHFEALLKYYKMELDNNIAEYPINCIPINSINLTFDKNINLDFGSSIEYIGLQIADLLSGFVMRFFKDFDQRNNNSLNKYSAIFRKLLRIHDLNPSLGIEMVVPQNHINELIDYTNSLN